MTFRFNARAALERIKNEAGTLPKPPKVPKEAEQESQTLGALGTLGGGRPGFAASPDDLRDALEERAAIIHEGHTRTLADDGTPLAAPIFGLTWAEAEAAAGAELLGGEASA